MSKLRLKISMSLDGYVAGPSQSVENALGIGGGRLPEWAFQLAVFRALLGLEGGTSFHFITDGIVSALAQARRAAAGKDVTLAGGAKAAQQFLDAGLVDEMEINLVATLLGSGERLFEYVGDSMHGLTSV